MFALRYCSPSCQEASRTLHQTECRLLKEERQEKERKKVEAVGDWTFSHVMTFEQYWQKMDTKVHKLCRSIGDSPDDLLKISFDRPIHSRTISLCERLANIASLSQKNGFRFILPCFE